MIKVEYVVVRVEDDGTKSDVYAANEAERAEGYIDGAMAYYSGLFQTKMRYVSGDLIVPQYVVDAIKLYRKLGRPVDAIKFLRAWYEERYVQPLPLKTAKDFCDEVSLLVEGK